MAYTYKKLSDVALVDSVAQPNLLVEDGGEIKKIAASNISVPQVKADWNETDANSAAFILNKPDLSQVGGGANVITYTINYSSLMLNGSTVSAKEVADEWNNGSTMRVKKVMAGTEGSTNYMVDESPVIGIRFNMNSGSLMAAISYYDIDSLRIESIYC